jgi:hypothetical protein
MGRRAGARAELSIAIELYRAMDMTFWLPPAGGGAGSGGGAVRDDEVILPEVLALLQQGPGEVCYGVSHTQGVRYPLNIRLQCWIHICNLLGIKSVHDVSTRNGHEYSLK